MHSSLPIMCGACQDVIGCSETAYLGCRFCLCAVSLWVKEPNQFMILLRSFSPWGHSHSACHAKKKKAQLDISITEKNIGGLECWDLITAQMVSEVGFILEDNKFNLLIIWQLGLVHIVRV